MVSTQLDLPFVLMLITLLIIPWIYKYREVLISDTTLETLVNYKGFREEGA
jgi:hypothetical protein